MIKALSQFDQKYIPTGICPPGAEHTIFMSEDVVLGEDVYIGPNTQLLGGVCLGHGVHILGNVVIDGTAGRVIIGAESKIGSGVFIEGSTEIGRKCVVCAGCKIRRSKCGSTCDLGGEIEYSSLGQFVTTYASCIMQSSSCGNNCKLGAHINNTLMGNRVNAKYGDINLLDGIIGGDCNFSAGTTFYNFGGEEKNKTWVGSGSFVGGKIIAPRRIGINVYMVAGLTIREDIPNNIYVDPTGKFRPNEMQNDGNGHWVRIKKEQK